MTTTVPTTVPEVLQRAADLIDQRGHAKGDYIDANGCLCARGAIYAAVGIEPTTDVANIRHWPTYNRSRFALAVAAGKALESHIGTDQSPLDPVVRWNDAPERTAAEVSAAFRSAAEAAR
jgi:hypothetical protein